MHQVPKSKRMSRSEATRGYIEQPFNGVWLVHFGSTQGARLLLQRLCLDWGRLRLQGLENRVVQQWWFFFAHNSTKVMYFAQKASAWVAASNLWVGIQLELHLCLSYASIQHLFSIWFQPRFQQLFHSYRPSSDAAPFPEALHCSRHHGLVLRRGCRWVESGYK